jgi:DNA-binding HxlR family transcriptional regulator
LEKGTKRYGEIQRSIANISQKMLTQTLRQLERDGLIHREVQPTMPPVVEYTLTPLAETFIPYLRHLKHWIMNIIRRLSRLKENLIRERNPKNTEARGPCRSACFLVG